MSPLSHRASGIFSLLVVLWFPCATLGKDSNSQRERLRNLERQLKEARESLHEAHRELGNKSDRIAALEEQLESRSSGDSKVRTEPESKKDLATAVRKIRELEKRLAEKRLAEKRLAKKRPPQEIESEQVGKESTAQPGKKAGKFEVESISISYKANTAANHEGREEVHSFVAKFLAKNPKAKFRVEGGADDTEYETVNRDVAQNRARYLVDYLLIKGIPEAAFPEITGTSTKGQQGNQKFARVTLLNR